MTKQTSKIILILYTIILNKQKSKYQIKFKKLIEFWAVFMMHLIVKPIIYNYNTIYTFLIHATLLISYYKGKANNNI